jgi:Ca2+-binding RTX toxin-like protein
MAIQSGTADRDDIEGTEGDDQINALGGDDHVFGRAGNDTISGGAGSDDLYGDTGHDKVDGGTGDDLLDGGAGNDELTGGAGNDFIGGADGTDTAYGGLGNDTIGGGAGNDRLFGEAGADTLHGEAGNDSLYGGSGDDTLLGGADNDSLYGGPGQDRLSGGPGADNLYGGDGADILSGGVGDKLYGEAGDDVLIWDTEQTVLGPYQSGPDTLISGGAGYDTLRVNSDLLYYVWSFEADYQPGPFVSNVNLYHSIYGGGDTFIKLGDHTPEDVPGLTVDLNSIERIEVSGLGRLEYSNNAFPDDPGPLPDNFTVVGTAQDDDLSGGYGNEVLIGGAGNDTIGGGIGADRLEGGIGRDTVAGGPDADQFIYAFSPNLPLSDGQNASGGDGNDIILDFNAGERDVVRLDATPDITPVQASGISSNANEILVTQTAESATLKFGGNGATIQFDTLGVNDIGAISGDTLDALEDKIIGISGASTYDPFQIV